MFRCQQCSAIFKREDHRRRHELTHTTPQYGCNFPGCGMRFHRNDVLKRHEQVHVPDPTKRRRRPRRGVDPKIIDSTTKEDSFDHDHDLALDSERLSEEGVCLDCCHVSTVCTRCLDTLFDSTTLPTDCRAVLPFCVAHHLESQLPRFAFVHLPTARIDWTSNGRLLAMAALGAGAIPEYRTTAKSFFSEAVRSLTEPLATLNELISSRNSFRLPLMTFQTRIMLVEYAIWSQLPEFEGWGLEELTKMAAQDVSGIVGIYRYLLSQPKSDNQTYLIEEEVCRTCWTFYCLVIRVSVVFNKTINVPNLLKDVRLPGPDSVFSELDQIDRNTSCEHLNRLNISIFPFQQAIFLLLSPDCDKPTPLHQLSHFAQYILLHGLIELYDTALTVPYNFPTFDAFLMKDKAVVQVRDKFWFALRRWHLYFWVDNNSLWTKGLPDLARLQSNMLLDFLVTRITDADRAVAIHNPHYPAAIEAIVAMLESLSESGIIDVATKAHWFLDRATWWYCCRLAKALHRWALHIRSVTNNNARLIADVDAHLLHRVTVSIARMRKDAGGDVDDTTYCDHQYVEICLERMWTVLLGSTEWMD